VHRRRIKLKRKAKARKGTAGLRGFGLLCDKASRNGVIKMNITNGRDKKHSVPLQLSRYRKGCGESRELQGYEAGPFAESDITRRQRRKEKDYASTVLPGFMKGI
jgi:hypothetical protein